MKSEALPSHLPLKGEGRIAEAIRGGVADRKAIALTPTRRLSAADLPLSGGGNTFVAFRVGMTADIVRVAFYIRLARLRPGF
jgi:hypothetical protein